MHVGRQFVATHGFAQALGETVGDLVEAFLHLAAEHFADSGKLLAQAAKQAAEVALRPVLFFADLEKAADPLERWPRTVAQAFVEPRMYVLHVQVDDLQGVVLLGREVVVEGAFRGFRGLQQRRDAQVVITVPEQ